MGDLEEIQEEEPEISLKIDRVGVKGIEKRIITQSPEGELHFDTELEAYVDLPKSQRGVHMSRSTEVFLEAVEAAKNEESLTLEEVLSRTCNNLLDKHRYANRAEVIANTNYYFEEDFTGVEVHQAADVTMEVRVNRDGEDFRSAAVTIPGLTVCPSAQDNFHDEEGTPLQLSPSHSQRAELTIRAETVDKFVRLEHLVEAARKAFSSPTVSLLKRPDEHSLIKHAFKRPRFIEDLERHALHNLFHILIEEGYPHDTELFVEAESFESIHPYNTYACRTSTLGELEVEEEEGKRLRKEG